MDMMSQGCELSFLRTARCGDVGDMNMEDQGCELPLILEYEGWSF